MTKTIKKLEGRYQLRYAAGRYYLLDMNQTGVPYKRPMEMNTIGAQIWQMMVKGYTTEQVIQVLASEYEADVADIREDVQQFQGSLITYGIEIGE